MFVNMNTTSKVIAGLVLGALVGALTGVLLAPSTGKTTRKKINRKAKKLVKQLEGYLGIAKPKSRTTSGRLHKNGRPAVATR
jgi:gas vesicle protein